MNILIVEDDESIANLIKINLTAEGYKCICAYDGKTGADGGFSCNIWYQGYRTQDDRMCRKS